MPTPTRRPGRALALLAAVALGLPVIAPLPALAADEPATTPTPTMTPAEPAAAPTASPPATPVPTAPATPTPTPTPADTLNRMLVTARFNIDSSDRYGVGQLVSVRFSQEITNKAEVERRVQVTAPVDLPGGSWAWLSDRQMVYRPTEFWPGRTVISFSLNLGGVELARTRTHVLLGASGLDEPRTLRTARSLVMSIRDSRHTLVVRRDGEKIKEFPVSLGKKGWETYSGIKVLTGEKYARLRMVGNFPKRDAKWDVISPWSIRLTPNGEFLHGAPWAAYRMGKANGSHGCTNLFPRHARWLYKHTTIGDPVVTRGTGNPMPPTLGAPGAYWNYSRADWRAFSALAEQPDAPVAVQQHPRTAGP